MYVPMSHPKIHKSLCSGGKRYGSRRSRGRERALNIKRRHLVFRHFVQPNLARVVALMVQMGHVQDNVGRFAGKGQVCPLPRKPEASIAMAKSFFFLH